MPYPTKESLIKGYESSAVLQSGSVVVLQDIVDGHMRFMSSAVKNISPLPRGAKSSFTNANRNTSPTAGRCIFC